MLMVAVSGIGAQRKGAKPAAAPAAVATSGATGTIRGRVLDSANGEAMIGVTAVIKELGVYGITDIDGNYVITNVPVGEQTVTYQITGYQPSATKVTVGTGKAAVANVTLNYKVSSEVVVTAKRVSNTDASLLSKRKKAAAAQDAISAEQISKSPDNDAGDAVKRVTGITLVGGKYIYIRGLGERYTTVEFNGALVTSPEPDKRVVPLDIFPTGILDNLTVAKTYTAEMPAEFVGGLLQINSKDFPEEREAKVSVTTGFNTITTLQDFKTFGTSALGYMGFADSSTRTLPNLLDKAGKKINTLFYTKDQINEFGREAANTQWTPGSSKAFLPFGFNVSFGNTYDLGDNRKLGVSASALFREASNNVESTFTNFTTSGAKTDNFAIKESTYTTAKSALLTLGYAPGLNDKFKFTSMTSQLSTDTVKVASGFNDEYSADSRQTIMQGVFNTTYINQLSGEHHFKDFLESTLDYTVSHSFSNRNEPDSRYSLYVSPAGGGAQKIIESPDEGPSRINSRHNESLIDIRGNYSIPFYQWTGLKSKITFGSQTMFRDRESATRRFRFLNLSTNANLQSILDQPLEQILTSGNIDYDNLARFQEFTEATDTYSGSHRVYAGYSQVDVPIVSALRFVVGTRYEKSQMSVRTFDQFNASAPKVANINADSVLPSATLIYSITSDLNLRLSGSQTIARPDFKEMSPFRFTNVVDRRSFFGAGATALAGLGFTQELKQTQSTNADIRLEWFPSVAEIIAITGFYKDIRSPLETVAFRSGSSYAVTVANIDGGATVMGGEFEIRKNAGFIGSFLKPLTLATHVAIVDSRITFDKVSEYTNKSRAMQGQSPYVINISADWNVESWGSVFTLLYNVYGARIIEAGTGGLQDFYEQPNGRLDASYRQKITDSASLRFTAANLTDVTRRVTIGKDSDLVQFTDRYGISYGFGFDMKF